MPLTIEVTAGQAHESTHFESVMDAVKIGRRRRPLRLAGDKAYSCPRIRRWLTDHGIEAVIPQRRDERGRPGCPPKFDRDQYKRRNVVERCINWLKECRRLATRYEKLVINYAAMAKLAMIQQCFRRLAT